MPTNTLHAKRASWCLNGQLADDQPVRRFRIQEPRFRVGRKADSSLCIPNPTVSREHAELTIVEQGLLLRDLGSTNGTYVNGTRAARPCTAQHGDLLQFGQVVFRAVQQATDNGSETIHEDSCDRALALIQFDQLMTQRAVTPHFQPIIDMSDCRVFGYEVLGRSQFFGLRNPHSMFAAAKVLNLEGELSRILREEGIRSGQVLPAEHALFVNTHPIEMEDLDVLILSLHELRELEARRPLVLEIHETAVTASRQMAELRSALNHLRIGLAYDDFGGGQARLVELVEVPPDYLKFDMKLVQNLDTAPSERQRMLASLVQMVRDLGIIPLAEGIEKPGDDAICRKLGFTRAQGFYYGYPELPRALLESAPSHADDTVPGRETKRV